MSFSDFLSLTRIPVALLFSYTLMRGEILISLILFLFGSFSDFLDGLLSRKVKKSKYGYLLDPTADRIFIGISFISLYYVPLENDISLFLLLMVVGQDLLLSPIGLYLSLSAIKKGKAIKSSPVGKVATFVQYIFVIYLLTMNVMRYKAYLFPFEITVVVFSIASGLHHLYIWLHILMRKGERSS